ncbi:MAG: hypothetical protein IJP38_04535 [Oscillospiraceae bacterium]|nr:hypothetical protein [Oscillospiraceae bacterium]
MKIKIIYPDTAKHSSGRRKLLKILKWPFLAALIACPIVNVCVGGKAWSIIAVAGIAMVWSLVFAPDLVEYNRLSQSVKAILYACIMLILIDVFLVSGWALLVVPIVCLGGLILSSVLFFSDCRKQKQNMLPMLFLVIIAVIAAIAGLFIWKDEVSWPFLAMGGAAVAQLIACIIALRGEFIRELQKRFHIK